MGEGGKVMREVEGREVLRRIREGVRDEGMRERIGKGMGVLVERVKMRVREEKEKVLVIGEKMEELELGKYV